MIGDPIPREVREAFDLGGAPAVPIEGGWINRTYLVEAGGRKLVLQRLHPIFRGEVNLDIDALTRRLGARGMPTPLLVRAASGDAWLEAEGVWRALTFVEGRTQSTLDAAHARSAGALVGRFHLALAGFEHVFAFTRPGAHDTKAHLAKLAALRERSADARADVLAAAVLAYPLPELGELPVRIVHGDLKATNVLFAHDEPRALALVDLDTMAHGTIAIDLGDALRSWCNPTDESDREARFDARVFEAALEGYAEGAAGLLEPHEIGAIVSGVETLALELASRFAADVYEDRYFGWDASRFASRVEHNLARTTAQLSLLRSIASQRSSLDAIVRRVFAA